MKPNVARTKVIQKLMVLASIIEQSIPPSGHEIFSDSLTFILAMQRLAWSVQKSPSSFALISLGAGVKLLWESKMALLFSSFYPYLQASLSIGRKEKLELF